MRERERGGGYGKVRYSVSSVFRLRLQNFYFKFLFTVLRQGDSRCSNPKPSQNFKSAINVC